MTIETDFVHRLVTAFPALEPSLSEHLSDEEGELLPYLFCGDVADWLAAQADNAEARTESILVWLEHEYEKGSFDVRNLIDVGIVEMLPAAPKGDAILRQLGPLLRERAEVAGLL